MSQPLVQAEAGQINAAERQLISDAIVRAETKPKVVLEVGTWLGGGSTIDILRALESNKAGQLWGIEADKTIYEQMVANIRNAAPDASARFIPLFGRSEEVLPAWLQAQGSDFRIDLAFLDGGNNPMEQIAEFLLIDPHVPVGGTVMTHDAKLRKGKWLVPYLSELDNWQSQLHDVSKEGLFIAKKISEHPSNRTLRVAKSRLFRLRMEPAELAAAIFPSKLCNLVLGLMPRRLRQRLAEGRY